MRRLFLTTLLAVGLTACATTGGGIDPAKVDQLVRDVQAYTAQACGFLPLASSVTEVIGALAGAPGVGVAVSTVGNAICAGFVPRQLSPVGGTYVRNVATPKGIIKVKGTRVR